VEQAQKQPPRSAFQQVRREIGRKHFVLARYFGQYLDLFRSFEAVFRLKA